MQGLDPLNPYDLSQAETIGRRQCLEVYQFLRKHAPGFESAMLVSTAPHIGVRETRHPQARYVLTAADIVEEKPFDHPIAVGGYPIDIHSPDAGSTEAVHLRDAGVYQIPVESLLVREVDNLILAGRALGADHHASAAVRVTPIAMAIGQGAGTLAGLAVQRSETPLSVPYSELRNQLIKNGVTLSG